MLRALRESPCLAPLFTIKYPRPRDDWPRTSHPSEMVRRQTQGARLPEQHSLPNSGLPKSEDLDTRIVLIVQSWVRH